MTHEIVRLAQTELLKLEQELSASPVFQRIQALRRVVDLYRGVPEPEVQVRMPAVVKAKLARKKLTKTVMIVSAAVEYLREKKGRATSGELVKAVTAAGVDIGGKKTHATLASYLSNSPLFDNVKGQGYGLKEWWGTKDPFESEAPDSGKLSSASANGTSPMT